MKISPLSVVLIVAVVALVTVQTFTLSGVRGLEARIITLETQLAKHRDWTLTELARVRDNTASESATQQKSVEALREDLDKARSQVRSQVSSVAGHARQEALKGVQVLEARLAIEEQKQQEQHRQVATQIFDVRQVATSATDKITDVSSDVRAVRSEVATTRTEIQRTVGDLRKAVGDMGVMSGLIATNEKQLAALKALGDRNYYEFTLPKSKQPISVSDVTVLLKKTDPGRNRYTVEVRAEDRKIEKKDKTINEPVQFYMGRNRQPYEIVINDVTKDQVKGYLATPRVLLARE